MSDDIVARLRKQYVGNYNALLWDEAADEIERLRTQLEMWQDGNIMAESHRDEIERLRAERDEARREVCQMKGTVRWNPYFPHFGPKGYAENRGWDCHRDYK